MSTNSETVAAAAAVSVENVEASAQAAIDSANARAANAEAVASAVTDAAVQREISDRCDDIAEDVLQCREENQGLRTELAAIRSQIAELSEKVNAPPTVIVSEVSTPLAAATGAQSTPQPSPQATVTTVSTVNPESAAVALPVVETSRPRGPRLI